MKPHDLFRCVRLHSCIRNYSQFPKGKWPTAQWPREYLFPITQEKYLEKVRESGEEEILKKLPFRAAGITETTSQFKDVVFEKFCRYIMQDGKKQLARQQLAAALEIVKRHQVELYNKTTDEEEKKKIVIEPLRIMKMAVQNCRPLLKLYNVRRGGLYYQVPAPISDNESIFRSMKGIVNACRDKEGVVTFRERLAREFIEASQNKGIVVKQKIELHKLCEANRAYAHYRWR